MSWLRKSIKNVLDQSARIKKLKILNIFFQPLAVKIQIFENEVI